MIAAEVLRRKGGGYLRHIGFEQPDVCDVRLFVVSRDRRCVESGDDLGLDRGFARCFVEGTHGSDGGA